MKLILVTRGFPPSICWGSGTYAYDLARGLAQRGHKVDVFAPVRGATSALRTREHEGIRVFELPLAPRPLDAFRRDYIDKRQDEALADVLMVHGRYDRVHFLGLGGDVSMGQVQVAHALSNEVLVTLRDYRLFCDRGRLVDADLGECEIGPDPWRCSACVTRGDPFEAVRPGRRVRVGLAKALAPLGRFMPLPSAPAFARRERYVAELIRNVDVFLVPGRTFGERISSLGIPKEKVLCVPPALDPSRYIGYERRPSDGPMRFAFFGRIVPHKGLHTLLAAIERIEKRMRKKLRVTLHGTTPTGTFTPYEDWLRQRIAEGHLPVRRPGAFAPTELLDQLADTDVMLVPSLWSECAPTSVLHALACGIPVLGSAVPGLENLITDGVNGVLVPPHDVNRWTRAMLDFLTTGLRAQLTTAPYLRKLPCDFVEHLTLLEQNVAGMRDAGQE